MEKSKSYLECNPEDAQAVSTLTIHSHRVNIESSFYEGFAINGIRVDLAQSGFVSCSFKVPPRLSDRNGNLALGAIANIVDEVGAAVVNVEGLPMNVSVDMSISYLVRAKVDDELEITARVLGKKGGYLGTSILLKNKVTGEIIAEGRHSLFSKHASKL